MSDKAVPFQRGLDALAQHVLDATPGHAPPFRAELWLAQRRITLVSSSAEAIRHVSGLFYPQSPRADSTQSREYVAWDLDASPEQLASYAGAIETEYRFVRRCFFRSYVEGRMYELHGTAGVRPLAYLARDPLDGSNWIALATPDGFVSIAARNADRPFKIARALRELCRRTHERHGHVCFHASAVELEAGGVAIIGDSGSGKTTLALGLSRWSGAAWVANDRVLLSVLGDGAVQLTPVPLPLRADRVSLGFVGMASAYDWPLIRPKPPLAAYMHPEPGRAAKLEILPRECAELAGLRLTVATRLKALIFLLPDAANHGPWIRRVPLATEILARNCLTPMDPVFVDDWLGVGCSRAPSTQALESELAKLACFFVRRAPPGQFRAFLEEIDHAIR